MSELVEITRNAANKNSASEQLLTFMVDGQEYGVDILRVQEIRGWSAPMPIPNAPGYIKGVINIRGDVVPIADLRERLGLASLEYGQTTVVVVLRVQDANRERVMGVIVDAMSDVTNVPLDAMKPPPTFAEFSEAPLARGIATLEDKMITILDVDRIFGERAGR
ncbi:MAG: chemotaxis protein CheW [Polyangiaceae bacterium]